VTKEGKINLVGRAMTRRRDPVQWQEEGKISRVFGRLRWQEEGKINRVAGQE
jgi:hypothetical protein